MVISMSGSGKEEATWRARIEKKGTYEIFAYIPSSAEEARVIVAGKRFEYNMKNKGKTAGEFVYHVPVLHQYYIVSRDGGESAVAVSNDSDEEAWVSLGQYPLSPGEHVVRLQDKRDHPDQRVHADAVKWLYAGME
jgi:hypothetical protein